MSIRPLTGLFVLAACALRPYTVDDGATEATSDTVSASVASTNTEQPPPDFTASASTSGGSGATTGSIPTSSSTSSSGSPVPPDVGSFDQACDIWLENCPGGQKCMPYSSDGGSFPDAHKCVPIVTDPAGVGEPCTALPLDTCAQHHICWDVDPNTGMGLCLAMCTGSPDMPACPDPNVLCTIGGESILILCLPQCDPIAQDCFNDDVCIPNPMNPDAWICVIDASGDEGQLFEPCEYANACDPGLMCAEAELAAECDPMALGCCLPFCDTDEPNTCAGGGQVCIPWYDDPADAADFNVDVGLCQVPMP